MILIQYQKKEAFCSFRYKKANTIVTVISNNNKPCGFVIAAGKNRFRIADIHFKTMGYIRKIGDMFQYEYANGVRFRSNIYDPLFLFDDETTPKGE